MDEIKINKNLGQKGHRKGKNFVIQNEIKCKWCRENLATTAAHVVGKAHRDRVITKLKKTGRFVGEIVPKDYFSQMSADVHVGITCPSCDNFIANNYEIKQDWKEIQATLWKITCAQYFTRFEDPHGEVSQGLLILSKNKPNELSKKEIRRMMKCLKNGLQNNEQVFYSIDFPFDSLRSGHTQTQLTLKSERFGKTILTKLPTLNSFYFHTEKQIHYLTVNLKKLDDFSKLQTTMSHLKDYNGVKERLIRKDIICH